MGDLTWEIPGERATLSLNLPKKKKMINNKKNLMLFII